MKLLSCSMKMSYAIEVYSVLCLNLFFYASPQQMSEFHSCVKKIFLSIVCQIKIKLLLYDLITLTVIFLLSLELLCSLQLNRICIKGNIKWTLMQTDSDMSIKSLKVSKFETQGPDLFIIFNSRIPQHSISGGLKYTLMGAGIK